MNTIQPLNGSQINSIISLLNLFDLPVSDLETAPVHFFGIKEKNNLIVIGALEIYSKNAVLRSVAVHPDFQNSGYGKEMIHFLENKALEFGVKKLFLLTTTADGFFTKLNYQSTHREFCPDDIKSSTQFAQICPSTASTFFKNLVVKS